MKKILGALLVACVCLLIQFNARADLVRMKNGRLIEGNFLGCTADAIQIQTAQGIVACPIPEILTISFLPTSSPLAPETAPLPKATPFLAKTPTPPPKPLIIAPGTRLQVRLINMVDTMQNKKDDWFTATLEAAVMRDGLEVLPKGATLRGQIVQAEQGKYGSALVITLRQLLLKQQILPIATTSYAAWNKPAPTADPNSLRRQRTLRIPDQAVLEFKTTEPIRLDEKY